MKSIALLGEYSPTYKPHIATSDAIEHSCNALGVSLGADWISTVDIDSTLFSKYSGIWVAPGSPYKNLENTLRAIRTARENLIPCLGTCGGFQHMILEYARNVLHYAGAQHAEYDAGASDLFISELECSLAGHEMELSFVKGSKVAGIYGSLSATEEYYCNFGVNAERAGLFKNGPLRVSGSDAEGEIRVIELHDHPFFVATLYVPQTKSRPLKPHPLVDAFIRSVVTIPDGAGIGRGKV